MRILIVDDEPPARRRIRALLADIPDAEIVGECGNGRDAIAGIAAHKPDVVFLDIQMPELDGFDVVNACRPPDAPLFVFVTAFDQHAIRAFDVHALDYLLKPFDQDRFHDTLRRARDQIAKGEAVRTGRQLLALLDDLKRPRTGDERIAVKESGRTIFVPVKQIDWIESAGNYVTIHAGTATHMLRETMKGMETRLNPRDFRRIHRNFIVNTTRVAELHPWSGDEHVVVLRNGAKLPVSRRFRRNLEDGA
jgi:two-component system LytT family response regulator